MKKNELRTYVRELSGCALYIIILIMKIIKIVIIELCRFLYKAVKGFVKRVRQLSPDQKTGIGIILFAMLIMGLWIFAAIITNIDNVDLTLLPVVIAVAVAIIIVIAIYIATRPLKRERVVKRSHSPKKEVKKKP